MTSGDAPLRKPGVERIKAVLVWSFLAFSHFSRGRDGCSLLKGFGEDGVGGCEGEGMSDSLSRG